MSINIFAIGYAQQTITPSLDRTVYLAGFGQNRVAQDVHDDLYVRAVAMALGDTRVVLAALDLLGLSRIHCQEIKRRVNERVPGVRLILACTHTHHGPDTLGLWGPDAATSGTDREYLAGLLGYILPKQDYVYPDNPFDPGDHYEETMSIGPEAGPRLLSTVRAMLR